MGQNGLDKPWENLVSSYQKVSTQHQKDQLIAKIATGFPPDMCGKQGLQDFLGDPEGMYCLAEWLTNYVRYQYPIVPADKIMELLARTNRDTGSAETKLHELKTVFQGHIIGPTEIDFLELRKRTWFLHGQTYKEGMWPTGYDILCALVEDFSLDRGRQSQIWQVTKDDEINGLFGIAEILYLHRSWSALPGSFRKWAVGKTFYGWRDIIPGNAWGHHLSVFGFSCFDDGGVSVPTSHVLSKKFGPNDLGIARPPWFGLV